uniref:PARP-type domain-containing protein n=1 Tax=Phaeocystis antarctica TaxID=33657 RepID=A0A7S0HHT3_9EUKA
MSTAKCWSFGHIGVAPSSASGCKECGEKISKGGVRLGQDHNSRYGGVAWRHLACIGVTSGVTEQGYKVPVVPSEARLPLLHGWDSLSGEQQAAVQAVCHAKTQPAKPARPDPMAWAPPAPTTKVAQGKKRKATEPQAQPLPLPLVAGYIVVD